MIYHAADPAAGHSFYLTISFWTPGARVPLILDTHGTVVRTLPSKGAFSYAGVSQNGKRLALQIASDGR